MARSFVEPEQLSGVARAFRGGRRLDGVTRLRGGSKKGVYRLNFDDGSTAILYVWDGAENYWPAQAGAGDDRADPFSDASGLDLFEAARARLAALGVRTPRAYLVDGSRTSYPADIALIEDVRGGTLEALLRRDPRAGWQVLDRLAGSLRTMHQHHAGQFGKVALVERGAAGQDRSCERIVLNRALRQLGEVAARVERIAAVHERLADLMREIAAAVQPCDRYGLIHGELGPDHVLVDEHGQPVLIDIEGLMHFDVEWEHAFLEMRFHDDYRWLRDADLDERRLRLYRLALHISLVEGPLRLLDGDFPDREFMLGIVRHNTDRTLSFLT
jgi:hypothetical protein